MWKYLSVFCLFALGVMMNPVTLSAQNDGFEEISWDDDDDEEEEAEDLSVYKVADVWVNEEKKELTPEMELEYTRNDTFMIKVRHLKPASFVFVNLKKAGMKLEKKNYRANNKGELDLEVRTGKRRVKGSAELKYTAGSGESHSIDVKLAIK